MRILSRFTIPLAASLLLLLVPGQASAFSQTDISYYDGFQDLTGLDPLLSQEVILDTLGGVRLVTNGPDEPAVWTTQGDFTAPVAPLGPVVGLPSLDAVTVPDSLQIPSSPLAFRRSQQDPVLTPPLPLSVDGFGVGGMCAQRVDLEATYYLWYTGVPEDGFIQRIYLATSNDGKDWTKEETPVIVTGEIGAFDSRQLGRPAVLYDSADPETPFKMWYTAEGNFGGSIGYATSLDGRTWVKAGEVFGPGLIGKADSYSVSQPSVMYHEGIYRMWYTASDSNNLRISYATSPDGLVWSRGGVVIDIADGTGNFSKGAWSPTVWWTGTDFGMLFTGGKDVGGGRVQTKLITATSADGVVWTTGNIALNPGNSTAGDFDGYNLAQPFILADPTDAAKPWKMWYVGNTPDPNGNYHDRVGAGYSVNGSKWYKDPGPAGDPYWNSVLTLGDQGAAFDSMKVADLRPVTAGEGLIYGFYTGTNAADFADRIGVVQSADGGLTWTDITGFEGAAIVDLGPDGAFDEAGVATPAPVDTGFDWAVYHTSVDDTGDAAVSLHRVSYDLGTVTRTASPVISPGAGFDSAGSADPYALMSGTTITLYYAGLDSLGSWSIGYATAELAALDLFGAGTQLLAPTPGSYDSGGLRRPVVLQDALGWHIWYTAVDDFGVERIAYASSPDGLTWTKQGLAMDPSTAAYDFAEHAVWPGAAWIAGESVVLSFTGTDRFGWRRVGLATAAGAGFIDGAEATYELTNAEPRDWREIVWTESVPEGTSLEIWVSYYPTYSGLWSNFFRLDNLQDLPFLLTVSGMRWQARMTSPDPLLSPRLDDMTVNHAPISFPAAGQAVTIPVGPPEGKYLLTWGDLTIQADVPGSCGLTVAVADQDGTPLLPPATVNGGSLTVISLADLRPTSGGLTLTFALTGDTTDTPLLRNFGVTFTSTDTPSSLVLTAEPSVVPAGGSTTVTGVLSSDLTPLAGQNVLVRYRTMAEETYTDYGTFVTDELGTFSFVAPISAATIFRAEWEGGLVGETDYPPAVGSVTVGAESSVTARIRRWEYQDGNFYVFPLGGAVVIKGKVSPDHSVSADGVNPGQVTVVVYRRKRTAEGPIWVEVKRMTKSLNLKSVYRWRWAPTRRGRYRYEAAFEGDADHEPAAAPVRYVRIY